MPKEYKWVKVPTLASDEVSVTALISSEAERVKCLACYPDDALTTSYFVAYHNQRKVCDFYLDNLVGEASKRIELDRELPLGHKIDVGYRNPAGVSGDKYVVVEFEVVG